MLSVHTCLISIKLRREENPAVREKVFSLFFFLAVSSGDFFTPACGTAVVAICIPEEQGLRKCPLFYGLWAMSNQKEAGLANEQQEQTEEKCVKTMTFTNKGKKINLLGKWVRPKYTI